MINEKIVDPNQIKVHFFGLDTDWLIEDAKKQNLEDVVKVHGMVPRHIAISEQRKAQFLLLFAWNDPQESGIYFGKLFDYLAACRPILSIGYTDGGVIKELLDQTQAGVYCSNEIELREFLLKGYHEYKEHGTIQYRGIKADVMKYSHREMARKFADVLEEMMK